jgi:hypothetical protein
MITMAFAIFFIPQPSISSALLIYRQSEIITAEKLEKTGRIWYFLILPHRFCIIENIDNASISYTA